MRSSGSREFGEARQSNAPVGKAKSSDSRQKPGPEPPRAEVVSSSEILVRDPPQEDPDAEELPPAGSGWSSDPPDTSEFLLACCCPCIVAGRNWRDAKLGRFHRGCLPLGIVVFLFVLFTALPYMHGAGACSYPNVRFETEAVERFFTGQCSSMEYATMTFARLFYACAVLLLFYNRKRLAAQLGIREKPCPAMFCQCCCCYACLLVSEMRTVQEVLKKQEAKARSAPAVGAPVMVRGTV